MKDLVGREAGDTILSLFCENRDRLGLQARVSGGVMNDTMVIKCTPSEVTIASMHGTQVMLTKTSHDDVQGTVQTSMTFNVQERLMIRSFIQSNSEAEADLWIKMAS